MSEGEFRFTYFTSDYESTVVFYRDGLAFPVVESWDRGGGDRGTLFAAASGRIEVLERPTADDAEPLFDPRPPQGAFMVIEVADAEEAYRRAIGNDLLIQKELSRQSWGHHSFCVREPNGLTLYFFGR
ncbi:VOC family protein [Nocardia brevicatena]|uniref:VOC family protein n=1 Tax=Nocardia brevicatena TaxID=37327 RepID=UPI00031E0C79|nr:VOC family protein [Nocardia brevicatena]